MKGYEYEQIIGEHYQILFPDFLIEKQLPKQELEEAYKMKKFGTKNWRSSLHDSFINPFYLSQGM